MEQFNKKQKIVLILLGSFVVIGLFIYVFTKDNTIEYSNIDNLYEQNVQTNTIDSENIILVHIIGEVKQPGIVKLIEGDRITHAIEAAGGATEQADLSRINLAQKVQDGQKIHIPNEEEETNTYITDNIGQNDMVEEIKGKEGSKININIAKQTELEQLTGIGPATALKIIQYREENGKFDDLEDIKNVPGIGDAKFNQIKDDICLN